MATHFGIGFSQHNDVATAAHEAAYQSKINLKHSTIDLAIVLFTVHYPPQQTCNILNEVLGQTKVIGCSTAGIILSNAVQTRGLAVLTIASDDIKFGIGAVQNLNVQDMRQAGSTLARETVADFKIQGRQVFMFFVDGFLKNNSLLLKGLQEILGNVFPIIGGGTCDDFHFAKTFQLFRDKALINAAVGLVIGGNLRTGIGARHGWRPLGKPRFIDKTQGNLIITIDGKKASSLYEEYFGKETANIRSRRLGHMAILYPLGIKVEGQSEYLLRNAVDILEDGSIVCQGDIPEGNEVHIMIGNKDSCKQAAVEAAEEAKRNLLGRSPQMVIIIESMARLKLLGRTAFHEIKKIKEIFGSTVPIFGMYANGEICPFQFVESTRIPLFQNESIVVLAIS